MSLEQLPINVFDFVMVAVLILGLVRGRKHGMSEELLLLIKWLVIVAVTSLVYEPLGRQFAQVAPFSLLSSYLIVYICTILLILGIFALLKHNLGSKLIGSDVFGRAEYYLGMGSGLIRFACMLVVGLALLNARYFSPTEVRAMERYQDDVYGSRLFPTLPEAQTMVFQKSLAGPWVRGNLDFLLIKPTAPPSGAKYQQREAGMLN